MSWSPDAPAAAPVAAPAAAQPAPVAEEAESATKFESETEEPLEDAALPLSELPVFVEEDSLACFQGDAGLLRHVSRSMLSVLQSKFIPGLKNAVDNLLASSVFELLREVLVFLLSLTECVIAPRLRRSAIDAQKALSSSSSSQGDELQASDETFVTTAYTKIKDGDDAESILKNAIPDLVLLGATETLIENLDLFVVTLSRVE